MLQKRAKYDLQKKNQHRNGQQTEYPEADLGGATFCHEV